MKKPISIIFDTDIGGDCDDAGALAMLHRLIDKGEAELLAVTHCYASPWLAGCIDAINRFYGHTAPIGVNYAESHQEHSVYDKALCDTFPNSYPSSVYGTDMTPPDTLTVLRKTLSEAEDGSVTFVVTGALGSMARLVTSPADDISPLTGIELIQKKIRRTVVMGGRFTQSWPMTIFPDGRLDGNPVTWEWNIKYSGLQNVKDTLELWPGELVFSSYEIGSYLLTMVGYPDRAPQDDPVALAYQIHNQGRGRCSWDQSAMLEAVRPNTYWTYHEFGKVDIDDNFVTSWSPSDTARHSYLLPKTDYETIRQVMDDLVDGK